MILNIILLSFLLGSSSYKVRQEAKHSLIVSEYTFGEIRKVYDHKDIQSNPEIRLTLYDILRSKYNKEYSSLHRDYYENVNKGSLERAFKQEMKYGSD